GRLAYASEVARSGYIRPPVRVLLEGSAADSGSVEDLGRALVRAGHDVIGLERSSDRATLWRRPRAVPGHGYPVWSAASPERALPRLLRMFEPEVVVSGGFDGVSWRRCAALARRAGARTVEATDIATVESAVDL